MIGTGLRKLAQENSMQISNGVAYGNLKGYAATFSEGSGYKQITFAIVFSDPADKTRFMDAVCALDEKELFKKYRIRNIGVAPKGIALVFHDTIGTMGKIRECLDWILPLLKEHNAAGIDTCSHCGMPLTNGQWAMIDGTCFYVHSACADALEREVEQVNEEQKQNRTGSYVSGAIGALLGAALGAVVWAFVLSAGFVAALVGLLIGWLSDKGYCLMGGRQGRGKVAVLIVEVIFGVALGTLAADVIALTQAGVPFAEIPGWMAFYFENPEYISITVKNILMGLVFAGLGVFAMLRNAGKAVADTKFTRLN